MIFYLFIYTSYHCDTPCMQNIYFDFVLLHMEYGWYTYSCLMDYYPETRHCTSEFWGSLNENKITPQSRPITSVGLHIQRLYVATYQNSWPHIPRSLITFYVNSDCLFRFTWALVLFILPEVWERAPKQSRQGLSISSGNAVISIGLHVLWAAGSMAPGLIAQSCCCQTHGNRVISLISGRINQPFKCSVFANFAIDVTIIWFIIYKWISCRPRPTTIPFSKY